jgi:S-adenosyl methyltransferase
MLLLVLHLIPDSDDPHALVASLMDPLPPGSALAISPPDSKVAIPAWTEPVVSPQPAGACLVRPGAHATCQNRYAVTADDGAGCRQRTG